MRKLAVGASAGIIAILATGCYEFPHRTDTLNVCNVLGWGSDACGYNLCKDYAAWYDVPFADCPPDIRYGSGPR